MTVSEVEGHDLLVDLLLTKHCLRITTIVQTSVNEAGVVGVEPDNIAFDNTYEQFTSAASAWFIFIQTNFNCAIDNI